MGIKKRVSEDKVYAVRAEFCQRGFRKRLRELKGYKCCNCGSEENTELHHIVPVAFGGTNNIENIVVLCGKCHKLAHFGADMNHTRNGGVGSGGRPRHDVCTDVVYKIYDLYLDGEIGTKECIKRLGRSSTYKMRDIPSFKDYLKERKIKNYRNNYDLICSKNNINKPRMGCKIGYVAYDNGFVREMLFDDKINKNNGMPDLFFNHENIDPKNSEKNKKGVV